MTPNQYLLGVLAEECMEVAQRASKAIRFTLEEVQPGQNMTNEQRLVEELNDLLGVIDELQARGVKMDNFGDFVARAAKRAKIAKFMTYSAERGTVTIPDDQPSPDAAVDPGEGWRLLDHKKDQKQEGDEWFYLDDEEWIQSIAPDGDKLSPELNYRRRITAQEDTQPPTP